MRCKTWTSLLCGLIHALSTAQRIDADVVLDDFIDDVHIVTPQQAQERIVNSNVGDLNAERLTVFSTPAAVVVGTLDINVQHESVATSIVRSVDREFSHLSPRIFQIMRYDFPGRVDLTDGGRADAFFVDFQLNGGPVTAERIRFLPTQDAGQGNQTWEQSFSLIEERLEPFTAVFPFSKFVQRGGGPPAPPFLSVPRIDVDIVGGGYDNSEWEIRIDAIRIGALSDGDYNADGFVAQEDLDLVLLSWGSEVAPFGWYHDLPISGVGQDELDKVLLNWGDKIVPPSVAGTGATAIPEPASAVLMLVVAALIVTRHGRVE